MNKVPLTIETMYQNPNKASEHPLRHFIKKTWVKKYFTTKALKGYFAYMSNKPLKCNEYAPVLQTNIDFDSSVSSDNP